MTRRAIAAVGTVLFTMALVIGTAGPPAAGETTEQPGQCTTQHSGQHITTSLTVPSGATCVLYNTQVDGSITIYSHGVLVVDSGGQTGTPSLIKGGITDQGGYLSVEDSTVKGGITLNAPVGGTSYGSGAGQLCGSNLAGVTISNMPKYQGFSIGGGSCSRFECEGPGVCSDQSGLNGNYFTGGLTANGNQSPLTIEGNTLNGGTSCSGNSPAPQYFDNTVKGSQSGQCRPPSG